MFEICDDEYDNNIVIIDDTLSSKLCESIISRFECERDVKPTSHSIHKHVVGADIFKTLGIVIDEENKKWIDIFDILYESVNKNLKIYSEKTNFSKSRYNNVYFPYAHIQKILKGGFYKPHIDNFTSSNEYENERIVTFIWYLNDVRNGGETHFLQTGLKIKPKVGRLAIFPSNPPFFHEGLCTQENKYIISTWLEVKKNFHYHYG
jgi:Rps23 Pro-64 3,4-dihydroxylase Tpa1-like proline 4-hydroxylase